MNKKVFNALKWIGGIFEKHNIKYSLSGGFAAHFYGSTRPINDLDFDIAEEAFDIIYNDIKDYLIFGPARYKSEYWDIMRATLDYDGQQIDLGGADTVKIFDKKRKQWVDCSDDFSKIKWFNFHGLKIPVNDPYELIEYKKILARDCDLLDIEYIEKFLTQNLSGS